VLTRTTRGDVRLPVATTFDMSQEPETLTIGQLADDLTELDSPAGCGSFNVWHDPSK
jgi:hypothetical protein